MLFPSLLQSKENQEKAWLLLCSAGLFLFHGLRDFAIVPAVNNFFSNTTDNPSLTGLSLAACHLGILSGYLAIPSLIGRFPLSLQLGGSLLFTGIFSMLILAVASHPWCLILIRGLQGIAQSWIYVITYAVLQEHNIEKFSAGYTFLFYMPWLGSATGLAIGSTRLPEIAIFIFGSLSIILSIATLFLQRKRKFEMGTKSGWLETLKSKAVLSTAVFHAGNTMALHTFLIGLPFTLIILDDGSSQVNWSFFLILTVLLAGAFTRLFGLLRVWFINSSLLSVLKRRKLLTLGGILVTVTSLCLAGTVGRNSLVGLIAPCIVGASIGGSICISAARMCFHDLAPCFPIQIMHVGNTAASFGAAVASLMFMGLSSELGDNDYITVAWIVPASIEVILIGQLIIFLSVDTLPHQFVNYPEKRMDVPSISFALSPSFFTAQSRSFDDKSFKSMPSALTFKTIPSSHGGCTSTSFVSMPDAETDVSAVWKSESGICHSIAPEKDLEMLSIKSDQSFKSVAITNPDPDPDIDKSFNKSSCELDRTHEWVNAYHMPIKAGSQSLASNHDQREKAQRNMLLALQW